MTVSGQRLTREMHFIKKDHLYVSCGAARRVTESRPCPVDWGCSISFFNPASRHYFWLDSRRHPAPVRMFIPIPPGYIRIVVLRVMSVTCDFLFTRTASRHHFLSIPHPESRLPNRNKSRSRGSILTLHPAIKSSMIPHPAKPALDCVRHCPFFLPCT